MRDDSSLERSNSSPGRNRAEARFAPNVVSGTSIRRIDSGFTDCVSPLFRAAKELHFANSPGEALDLLQAAE